MLKQRIKVEKEKQELEWTVLFDGICEAEEYRLWMDEDEPTIWLMQVHAMVQRLGRSVDKFDVMLWEGEYVLARWRGLIWRKIRQGEILEAEMEIAEYEEALEEIARCDGGMEMCDNRGGMPKGEQALHRQFLALAQAEITRRQARPWTEQLEIIFNGLRHTIPKAAWETRHGKLHPQYGWLKERRLHLMEQFLLARFARVWECMGKDEEAFLWYQGLSEYLLENVKDCADFGKLYPLLCYRMAKNRLYRIFGKKTWWEDVFSPKERFHLFVREDGDEAQGFRDAGECVQILKNLTDALKLICRTQKQYPLFRKMEHMRLMMLQNMMIFGDYTTEENTWRALESAWEDVQKMVSCKKEKGVAAGGIQAAKETDKTAAKIWEDVAAADEGNGESSKNVTVGNTKENDENVADEKIRGSSKNVAVYDNFDPDYMERSLHSLKELLQKRMELHGWNIYELGDGIYAEPKKSLIPVFKGTSKPKPKKLKMLQERLGMHWKDYDPGFLTEDDAEYKKYARMMRAYYSGKYAEGRKLLDELEEKIDWKYGTNEQFGIYWDALFDWKEGKITEQEKNVEMWKVVEYTGVKKERLAEVGASLMRPEWRALMEIAWNYEGEDLNFLARVLKKQKEYLEEMGNTGFFREYYIKILYCLCHIDRKQGNLDGAERYADKGLRMMYWLDMYTQWGALLFEKFRIVEERKDGKGLEEGDFKYIRQAYAVEKMFLKNEMFCVYIEEYLSEAYGQDMLADIRQENEITHRD